MVCRIVSNYTTVTTKLPVKEYMTPVSCEQDSVPSPTPSPPVLQLKPRGVQNGTFHPGTLHIQLPPALSCPSALLFQLRAKRWTGKSVFKAGSVPIVPATQGQQLAEKCALHTSAPTCDTNSQLASSIARHVWGMCEGRESPRNQDQNRSRSPSARLHH